ncbi:gp31 protein [Listeria monocytogenes FSL R2-561]|nr:gp31 protein [Listeria monocytogenes FSL R2-561]
MSLFLSILRNVISATARVTISRTVFISSKMSFTFSTPFYIYIIIHVLYNCKCFYKIIKKIPRTRKFEVAVILSS